MTSIRPNAQYTTQLESAVRAVSIYSSMSYAWFGVPSPKLPDNVKSSFTPMTARNYLLYHLQSKLYDNFYCTGTAVARPAEAPAYAQSAAPFIEQLSRANSGRGFLQDGWTVRGLEGGCVALARPDLALWVPPELCERQEGRITPGMEVGLHLPKEMTALSPGYYMAMGDQELEVEHFDQMLRVYWNVSSEGALALMRLITERLNMLCVPFRLKVVSSPHGFNRRDTAVLYIRKGNYGALRSILGGIYARLGDEVRHGVPALTRSLAPRLALAEDPGHGESYGLHRAMLVAEGLVRGFEASAVGVVERLSYVEASLVENGVDPRRPYLKPGSCDDYEPLPARWRATAPALIVHSAGSHVTAITGDTLTGEDYLGISRRIGGQIASEAIWYDGKCNWMGAISPESGDSHAGGYHALGPDLYGGSSGIALYLAELWSAVGDEALRRTAIGAINQALAKCADGVCMDDLGLYTGWPGVVLAAVRVGLLLHEEELVERARLMLRRFNPALAKGEPDLLSGSAGAIVALLLLREALGDHDLLDQAAVLGDGLLRVAEKDEAGYSWRAVAHKFPYNLTGFSHGTSGIGYALLELHAATREARYRQGAEEAFAYGRSWFDPEEANWPDLRSAQKRTSRKQLGRLSYVTYWCHGAPGIGLSRLRAYQLLGDDLYREEAQYALDTTRRAVDAALHTGAGAGDFSLCHGVSGLAQILLYGRQILGQEWRDTDTNALVAQVARMGIDRQAEAGGGHTPGLMVGQAGTGLFYLSLTNRTTPVLFPSMLEWKNTA
jgi:hypothetical protein